MTSASYLVFLSIHLTLIDILLSTKTTRCTSHTNQYHTTHRFPALFLIHCMLRPQFLRAISVTCEPHQMLSYLHCNEHLTLFLHLATAITNNTRCNRVYYRSLTDFILFAQRPFSHTFKLVKISVRSNYRCTGVSDHLIKIPNLLRYQVHHLELTPIFIISSTYLYLAYYEFQFVLGFRLFG